MNVTAILPAAGLGTRMGAETPKQFLSLDGVPVLLFTLRRLAACPAITDFVIATRTEEVDSVTASAESEKLDRPVHVVRGGDSRQDSVANALTEVPSEADFILVHDAVRPLVTRDQIERVIEEAAACDAAILGIPAMDTVKDCGPGERPSVPPMTISAGVTMNSPTVSVTVTSSVSRTWPAESPVPIWKVLL